MTSRIDFHACGVDRTSRLLVSSTADTPTLSPCTCSVTEPLPLPLWLATWCRVSAGTSRIATHAAVAASAHVGGAGVATAAVDAAVVDLDRLGAGHPGSARRRCRRPARRNRRTPRTGAARGRLARMCLSSYANTGARRRRRCRYGPATAGSGRNEAGCGVMTNTAFAPSSGMKRNMPATGDLPCSPNTFSRSETTSVALPDCSREHADRHRRHPVDVESAPCAGSSAVPCWCRRGDDVAPGIPHDDRVPGARTAKQLLHLGRRDVAQRHRAHLETAGHRRRAGAQRDRARPAPGRSARCCRCRCCRPCARCSKLSTCSSRVNAVAGLTFCTLSVTVPDTPGAMVKFCPSMSPRMALTTTCTGWPSKLNRPSRWTQRKPGGGALAASVLMVRPLPRGSPRAAPRPAPEWARRR